MMTRVDGARRLISDNNATPSTGYRDGIAFLAENAVQQYQQILFIINN
jgi:hypothetical protein